MTWDFDYIVVGSGPCGLAFAKRVFDADPAARILMLERGPLLLNDHIQNLPAARQGSVQRLPETFPWEVMVDPDTAITGQSFWVRGLMAYVGGRSTMWSGWCPRPTVDEMVGWPSDVIAAARSHFDSAETLLGVVPANALNAGCLDTRRGLAPSTPSPYSSLQAAFGSLLKERLNKVPSARYCIAAPLAVRASTGTGRDGRFSTVRPLLQLVNDHKDDAGLTTRSFSLVPNCVVTRISQVGSRAVTLHTTAGSTAVGRGKVILAMGTLPATTLILNSLPQARNAGRRFTAHFTSKIVARLPVTSFTFGGALEDFELAAVYIAGTSVCTGLQYHLQISVFRDVSGGVVTRQRWREIPDLDASPSPAQLAGEGAYLILSCAALGELDWDNERNSFEVNDGSDPTRNVTLRLSPNDRDRSTWDDMDAAMFQVVEDAARQSHSSRLVEYWHGTSEAGSWRPDRPSVSDRRATGLVHEGSTLWVGEDEDSVVGLDYSVRGCGNVYVTGGALWPTGGSWNPTLTMVALAQDLADQLVFK